MAHHPVLHPSRQLPVDQSHRIARHHLTHIVDLIVIGLPAAGLELTELDQIPKLRRLLQRARDSRQDIDRLKTGLEPSSQRQTKQPKQRQIAQRKTGRRLQAAVTRIDSDIDELVRLRRQMKFSFGQGLAGLTSSIAQKMCPIGIRIRQLQLPGRRLAPLDHLVLRDEAKLQAMKQGVIDQ